MMTKNGTMDASTTAANNHRCEADLNDFLRRHHSLRLSASRIAALTGYHPFFNLPEYALDLVYQGSPPLLVKHDLQALNLDGQLQSKDDMLMKLAQKASSNTVEALQQARQVKEGEKSLHNIQTAQQLKQRVLQEASKSQNLSKQELSMLKEGTRSYVDTGFGTHHENEALDWYEGVCGDAIHNRNAAIRSWKFRKASEYSVEPMGPAHDYYSSRKRRRKQDKGTYAVEQDEIVGVQDVSGAKVPSADRCNDPPKPEPTQDETNVKDETVGQNETNNGDEPDKKQLVVSDKPMPSEPACNAQDTICQIAVKDEEVHVEEMATCGKDGDKDESDSRPEKKTAASDGPTSSGVLLDTQDKIDVQDDQHHDCSGDSQPTVSEPSQNLSDSVAPVRNKADDERPFFTICGAVDGIRHELCGVDAETDEWQFRSVIVECKHRMNRHHNPPPLYDQIQTTAYCLMYETKQADLLQVIRRRNRKSQEQKAERKKPEVVAIESQPSLCKVTDYFPTKAHNGSIKSSALESSSGDQPSEVYNNVRNKENTPNSSQEDSSEVLHDDGADGEQTNEDNVSADTGVKSPEVTSEVVPSTASEPRKPLDNTIDLTISPPPTKSQKPTQTASDKEAITSILRQPPTMDIKVHRISLDDPLMNHEYNWNNILLPRLRSMVDAIYTIRSNTELRQLLLQVVLEEDANGNVTTAGWEILERFCPWLSDCDTAKKRL